MSAYSTAIKLAEKNGISVPEFIKFLASPAGYTISKALDALESQTSLPQGILSLAQNPKSAITNYVQTQAENAIYNQNEPSRIESIISELQGANPDKPNYVGPQEVDSTLSQQNTAMLPSTLGVQPTGEFVPSNIMNDDLREALYGTITPNYARFVGPQELNSPSDQIGVQFLAEDLGVKPTPIASNTSNSANNSSIPPEILQTIGGNVEGKSLQEDMNNISSAFGNTSPASLGLAETPSMPDYSRAYSALGGAESVNNLRNQFLDMGMDESAIGSLFSNYYAPEPSGGNNAKGLDMYNMNEYARGGFIHRGVR
jgi:hypothetical protein